MNEELALALDAIAKYAGEEKAARCFAIIEEELFDREATIEIHRQFERETTDVGCYGYEPERGYYDLEPIEPHRPSSY